MKKLILLSIYFIIIFLTNEIYRNKIFKYSYNSFEVNFQKSISKIFKYYFYFFTFLGNEYGLVPIFVIIIYISVDLFFILFTIFGFSVYWNGFLKLIYYSPRPFWINDDLFQYCETGYGNPSGHAMISTIFYLGIIEILIQRKKFNKSIRYFLKIICFFVIYNIMLSRIYFGVHSIDQVIYGHLLGLGFYYFFFGIIKIQNFNSNYFISNLIRLKLNIIVIYIISILFSFMFLIFIDYNSKNEKYKSNVMEQCPKSKEYRTFHYEAYYSIFITFGWLGCFLGYIFLNNFIQIENNENEENEYDWYKNKFKIKIIRIGIFLLPSLPCGIFFLFNFKSILKFFLFKTIIPAILGGFCSFGPGIYFELIFIKKYFISEDIKYNIIQNSIDI